MSMKEHELFVPLDHRPEASTLTVRELIGRVEKGRVRLPDFQRPLRWSGEDIRRLLDSVARGYPIGSLLFWKREALAEKVRVGNAAISAPAFSDSWWVVDGQQRTTALAACLLDLDQGRDPKFRPYFDVETQQFVKGPCPPDKEGIWVPVSMLGDLRRLGKWNRDGFVGNEEQWQQIEEMQQRLLDYSLPIYIVETQDEQALRGIFARMNSTGVRMRADEVFQALLGRRDDSQTPDIKQLQEWCRKEEFGAPSRNDVLKAVLAMSGIDFNTRLDKVPPKDLAQLVRHEDAESAFSDTIEFLRNECGIPHLRLLPYPVVFAILARWFCVFPSTSDEIRKHLARWVWRSAASGAHQRGKTLRMRDQVKAIDPEQSAEAAVSALTRETGGSGIDDWTLEKCDVRNAKTRMELLALWELQPVRPEGEVSFAALIDGDHFATEIYSKQQIRGLGDEAIFLAKTAANLVLLDESKKGVSGFVREWDPVANEHALRSHLIDEPMFQALRDNNVGTFLKLRGEALKHHMVRFLAKKGDLDLPYLAPVESYLDPGDWTDA